MIKHSFIIKLKLHFFFLILLFIEFIYVIKDKRLRHNFSIGHPDEFPSIKHF